MLTKNLKKNSLIAAMAFVCAITLVFWIYSHFYVSTDDAYVNANVTQIAPRVTGQIKNLYVVNNQFVSQGQLLFDLDSSSFIVMIDQARAQLHIAQANLKLAQVTSTRTDALLKRNVASEQQADRTTASLQAALAKVQLAEANLKQAELNHSYTKIVAPASGWVTNVTLRIGDMVSANQALFALVNNNEFWIDANFKETEMNHLHPGLAVKINIDMYGKHPFKGIIESISSGSGTAFSLLPPENATGNWVKVTQRVPVRIHILNPDPDHPLRIGTTASIVIPINPWTDQAHR